MSGENAARRAEDIGGQELSYAEVKAIASGNPAVLTLAEADAELQRLMVLQKNHADEQFIARRSVRDLPPVIEQMKKRLADLAADQATSTAHARDAITVGRQPCADNKAVGLLGQLLDSLPKNLMETRRFALGVYKGLRFGIVLKPQYSPEAFIEGKTGLQTMLDRNHHGPRAILNAVEELAGAYVRECNRVRQELAIKEGQLRDYQKRLGIPFEHDAYVSELAGQRDLLKAGLAGGASDEAKSSVSEIAERIKALKAAHKIDAAPERSARRRSSAEEPVTARIRRRAQVVPPAAGPASAVLMDPCTTAGRDQSVSGDGFIEPKPETGPHHGVARGR